MFESMTIKKKQALLLSGFFLSLFASVLLTLIKLGDVKDAFGEYDQIGVQLETSVLRIGKEVNYVSRLTRSIMLGDNYDKNMAALGESSTAIDRYFNEAKAAADKIVDTAKRTEFLGLIDTARTDTRAFIDDGVGRMHALAEVAPSARATAWSGYHAAATPLANKSRASFKQLSDLSATFMKDAKTSAETSINRVFTWLPAVALVAGALMAWLSYMVVTDLLRRLGGEPADAAALVKKIAAGDLNSEILIAPDDTDSLLAAVKSMQGDLRETIRKVSRSASDLHLVSEEVTKVIDNLTSTSSNQHLATSEMANTMESMAQNIRQVTANSNESWSVAREAGDLSTSGGTIVLDAHAEMTKIAATVNKTSSSIAELGKHSEQISTVANAIREIADQTNLLALNAAIEAARAGEQGRGFAVVADEVRKLAERTTKSTQEIGSIIGNILSGTNNAVASMHEATELVARGVSMIDRAGESMRSISEGSNRVIHSVSEINTALAAQEEASTLVSHRVESIARMTAENHGSIQEIAKVSKQLAALADSLYSGMSQFKV